METDDAAPTRPRTKRKRKPKYPKNFDPEHPGAAPNPERWLPKHERAEYLKRRKRSQRNQPVSKGAQVRDPTVQAGLPVCLVAGCAVQAASLAGLAPACRCPWPIALTRSRSGARGMSVTAL